MMVCGKEENLETVDEQKLWWSDGNLEGRTIKLLRQPGLWDVVGCALSSMIRIGGMGFVGVVEDISRSYQKQQNQHQPHPLSIPASPRQKRYKLPTPSFPLTIWEVGAAVNQHTLSLLFPTAARGSIPTAQAPVIPGPILGVSMVSELGASFCQFLASLKFLIPL